MSVARLEFFVSHVRVEVRSAVPEVIDVLGAVWACCLRPLVPTAHEARFEVRADDTGYAVVDAHGEVQHTALREDVLPLLEAALYRSVPGWHAHCVLLHAACVRIGSATAVLLGRSGAGKSSLTTCALRAGFSYFSDELTVTDGVRLWGVARAVQFEPVADGEAPAPWAGDVDLGRYRLRLADGRIGAVPLWFPDPGRVPPAPVPVAEARVVVIEHGDRDALTPIGTLAGLSALHEAAFQPPCLSLGSLVGAERCTQLVWRDPARAIAMLAAALVA